MQSQSNSTTVPVDPVESGVLAGRARARRHRPAKDRVLRAKLRRDVLSRGPRRKRTVRRRIRVPKFTRTRAPVTAQLCTVTGAAPNTTPHYDFDVLLRTAPATFPWTLGPALPTCGRVRLRDEPPARARPRLGPGASGRRLRSVDADADGAVQRRVLARGRRLAPARLPGGGSAGTGARRRQTPPIPSEPLPGGGAGALAGRRILINPRVPAGYDSARFVAVATRAISARGRHAGRRHERAAGQRRRAVRARVRAARRRRSHDLVGRPARAGAAAVRRAVLPRGEGARAPPGRPAPVRAPQRPAAAPRCDRDEDALRPRLPCTTATRPVSRTRDRVRARPAHQRGVRSRGSSGRGCRRRARAGTSRRRCCRPSSAPAARRPARRATRRRRTRPTARRRATGGGRRPRSAARAARRSRRPRTRRRTRCDAAAHGPSCTGRRACPSDVRIAP